MSANPKSYVGQIREVADSALYNNLQHHRLLNDGKPACGDKMRPWKGRAMTMIQLAPNTPVTCQRNGCKA
jgi:hypothetical protein